MIAQIKEFLPSNLAGEIQKVLLSDEFPWYFNNFIANQNLASATSFQFTHLFFSQEKGWSSDASPLIQAMLHVAESKMGFSITGLVRVKANLLTLSGNGPSPLDIHRDMMMAPKELEGKHKSLLYYVDDFDGNTLIFDENRENLVQQITPKFNSAILFDSRTWHSSSPPMQNKRRVVINSIFLCE